MIFPLDSGFHFSFLFFSSPFILSGLGLVCVFILLLLSLRRGILRALSLQSHIIFLRFCVCVRVIALPESPISREVHPYTSIFQPNSPTKREGGKTRGARWKTSEEVVRKTELPECRGCSSTTPPIGGYPFLYGNHEISFVYRIIESQREKLGSRLGRY